MTPSQGTGLGINYILAQNDQRIILVNMILIVHWCLICVDRYKTAEPILNPVESGDLKRVIDSVDPDQLPQNAASYQGLHCLYKTLLLICDWHPYVQL